MPKPAKITASTATLSGLVGGLHTVKDIAKATKMTEKQTRSALSALCRKGLATRTNKKGIGVPGKYKVTKDGRAVLREAKKKLRFGNRKK